MHALKSFFFLLLLLLVIALGVLVGIDNSVPVSLIFLEWRSPTLPVFVWVCMALIAGFLLGMAATVVALFRQYRARRHAERALDVSRRELLDVRQHLPGD